MTRPLVIMLSSGFRHAWFVAHRDSGPRRIATDDLGLPLSFEPQRHRAIRRALRLVAAVVLLLSGVVIRLDTVVKEFTCVVSLW